MTTERVAAHDDRGRTLYTIAEVAHTLRVSRVTVWRAIHRGDLPAIKVGALWRIYADDLHEYLYRKA